MVKVFENETKTKAVLAGRVSSIRSGISQKNDKPYCVVTISGTYYDSDMEMDMAEEYEVLFFDQESEEFGEQLNATRVLNMKIKEGSLIAVKANMAPKDDTKNKDGFAYYGVQTNYVAGGVKFNFKETRKNDAAYVLIGTAIHKKANEMNVPYNVWNAQENVTSWVTLKEIGVDKITNEEATTRTNEGKYPFVAFIMPKDLKKDTKENNATIVFSGEFSNCVKIG